MSAISTKNYLFTYNSDAPGFAYELLSSLEKHVIPVKLREGTGDRNAAVKYLEELIKDSEYAEYAEQAGEFMKQFPEDEFSQTDYSRRSSNSGFGALTETCLRLMTIIRLTNLCLTGTKTNSRLMKS